MTTQAIVLIGAPGAGKTTVGAELAIALGYRFVDTDAAVIERTGRPLAELYIDAGDAYVRDLELAVVTEALTQQPVVVALGSGALDRDEISTLLEDHVVIWLRVTGANAISRVGLNVPRPVSLGNVRSQFSALLEARSAQYAAAADHAIDTDHRPIVDLVADITTMLTGEADE